MLGVHEYIGHGIKNYSGGYRGTHWKAYDAQIKHSTFKFLSPVQQKTIYREKKDFMEIENPMLYQETYK